MFASLHPRIAFMLNGLSWPATERLRYALGKPVHWRVINLTSQSHPMHLHGFYFQVDSLGDGMTDVPVTTDEAHSVVTQLLRPGTTMAMTWTPERAGNWLFHCHVMHHVSPERRLAATETPGSSAHDHCDKAGGMAGMVLGVTVFGGEPDAGVVPSLNTTERRVLRLEMARDESAGGACLRIPRVRRPHPGVRRITEPSRLPVQRSFCGAESPSRSRSSITSESPLRCTGTVWSSTASTTACTAGAASTRTACADDRCRRHVRRAIHAAPNGNVHVPHAPAR